jgi:hypothetical protein
LLCHGEHRGAEIDPQHLPDRGDEGRCLEGYCPGTSPEIEGVHSWGQSGPPDNLLDDGGEARIDLALVNLRIAIPDPVLPG